MLRQLVSHSAAYTFASLASRGTVVVWLLVLPRFMSPADYGALGLITTVAALVSAFVPLEVGQGLARFYPGAAEAERRGWAASAWTFTLIMLGAAAVAALAAAPWLNRWLLGAPEYLPAMRIAIAYFVLNTGFFFVQSQFRWGFRARDYVIVTLVFAGLTLGLSIGLAAVLPDALTGVLIGLALALLSGLVLGLVMLGPAIGLGIEREKLKRMLRFSLPLVPASVALFLGTYASRFILNDLLSLTAVGQFTWASQLAAIPALLLLGVQGAITPLVMKHHAEPATPALLARSFEAIVAAELILCLALGLFTPELVGLLGYSAFAGAGPLVMLLAPAYVMLQLYVFAPGFAVAGRTHLQLIVSVATAITAVALNYWLIPMLGTIGAATATLGSGAMFIGLWLGLSQRHYPVPVRWVRIGAFLVSVAGVIGLGHPLAASATLAMLPAKLLLVAAVAVAPWLLGLLDFSAARRALRLRQIP